MIGESLIKMESEMLRSCFWDKLTDSGILSAGKKKERKKVSKVHVSASKQQTAPELLNKSQNVRH